jgi:hypothetical protein
MFRPPLSHLLLYSFGFCLLLSVTQVAGMAFDLLPTLRPRQWRATICVRVCRKWEYRGGTDDGPIQHVDLVLLDEKVCSPIYPSSVLCCCLCSCCGVLTNGAALLLIDR